MSDRWADIWASRKVEVAEGPNGVLSALIAADGFDNSFGAVSPSAWATFATDMALTRLGLSDGDSLFEVGCGAGAFLYPLRDLGLRVAGLDRSPALIEAAQRLIPEGNFSVGEASELAPLPQADAVVSCSVFFYFPDLDYAERVIRAMVAKSRRAVAILDVPDLATRDVAVRARIAAVGGEEAYAERYAGLDHLYYDRSWLAERLSAASLRRVQVADQEIPGYANGHHRFNAWGFIA